MATVPEDLRLLQSFVDSIDVESGRDDFETITRFRRWLTDHDRGGAAAKASTSDLALARRLRDGLRAALAKEGDPPVDEAARKVPLVAHFGADGRPGLGSPAHGVIGVLGDVLVAAVTAAMDGRWRRLRLCANDDCAVFFYDGSRNGSRRWCDMSVCGNRMKLRAFRARHRPAQGSAVPS